MDDGRLGAALRAARLRRRWRQKDLAAAARTSGATVSRLERGHLDALSLRTLRRIAAALDVRVEVTPRSRSGDLDRLVNARHAALADAVLARVKASGDWAVRPEVSIAVYGERGVVDLLAWHKTAGALLVIEIKTEIVDVGDLLGTLDRKRRLAAVAARPLGWRPVRTSAWLVVAESMTNRRRVAAYRATFAAALPDDGRRVAGWLRRPEGELRALSFVTDRHRVNVRSGFATLRRVPTRGSPSRRAQGGPVRRAERASSGGARGTT